jgi:hypothetical protein
MLLGKVRHSFPLHGGVLGMIWACSESQGATLFLDLTSYGFTASLDSQSKLERDVSRRHSRDLSIRFYTIEFAKAR